LALSPIGGGTRRPVAYLQSVWKHLGAYVFENGKNRRTVFRPPLCVYRLGDHFFR